MNRSKIEYCDHTWNPITGCRHTCHYCYARRMTSRFSGDPRLNKAATADYHTVPSADGTADVYVLEQQMKSEAKKPLVYPFGFEPTYHRYRVTDHSLSPLRTGCIVFVGTMCDMFGSWVPAEWINEIFDEVKSITQHKYLFLTKNPARYKEFVLPEGDFWYGTSITTETDKTRIEDLPKDRNCFLSIEPLRGPINLTMKDLENVKWIVTGAETGSRLRVRPELQWVIDIVGMADSLNIPVFMKDSLVSIVGEENMQRDYPEGMKDKVYVGALKDKMIGECALCKMKGLKSRMYDIGARRGRGNWTEHVFFLCEDCFKNFKEKMNA